MSDISNKTFGMLIGVALFVSVIGIFSTGNNLFDLTGLFTARPNGTGQVRINVTPLIAINMTQTVIDFGNGTVAVSANNCTISSNRIGLNSTNPAKCFPATWGNTGSSRGSGFNLSNIGNVKLNVTVKATKNSTSAAGNYFWGTGKKGKYMYKCTGFGTTQIATFTDIMNKTKLCMALVPTDLAGRWFTVDINLTIPKDAVGLHNDTLTFIASRACSGSSC